MTMLRKRTPHLLKRLLPRTTASIIVAGVIALPAGAGTAVALANTGDTSAVAINTKNGSSVFRLTFGVRQVNGSVVDPQNAAVAISSCADCQTVAISVEIVLTGGDATTVTPVNEAIAINESCTSCDTLAAADQLVYALGTKLKLTAEARQELAAIRQQLEQLRQPGVSFADIESEVSALMGQLSAALQNQVIAVNEPAAGPGAGAATTTTGTPPDTTATPTSTPTDTAAPTSTPTDTTSTPTDTTTPTSTPPDTTSTGTATGPTGSTSTTPTTTATAPTATGTTP